jgi:hypothetical protein
LKRRIVISLEASCEAESQPELIEKYETRVIGGSFLEIPNFEFNRSHHFWQGRFLVARYSEVNYSKGGKWPGSS